MHTIAGTTLPRTVYLDSLHRDFARVRELVWRGVEPVPSCPGWTTRDLADHLAHVYWHQSFVVKGGVKPEGDEHLPDFTFADSPERYLDLAFEAIRKALDPSRSPEREVWTWDPRSGTVDFWFRRMTHETVIHRFDAELAAQQTTAFDADLALDGIDELMSWVPMLADEAGHELPDFGQAVISVDGPRSLHYLLDVRPGSCTVATVAAAPAGTRLRIIGSAEDIDLLLWGRMPASNPRLIVDGETDDVATLLAALAPLGA